MKRFEINEFKRLLNKYFDLKQRTEPYNYREWFTDGENAVRCKEILGLMCNQLKNLIEDHGLGSGLSCNVDYSKGAGRFPRAPWIAVLFGKETAKNGVYPVIGLQSTSWYVGCVDSFANPQGDFSYRYNFSYRKTDAEMRALKEFGMNDFGHIALMPCIFKKEHDFTENELVEALRKAIGIYCEFRNVGLVSNESNKTNPQSKDWKTEVKVPGVLQWIDAIIDLQKSGQWVFRGQRDAGWPLETSLGREAGYLPENGEGGGSHEELRTAERTAMIEFSREVSRDILYRGLDGVELLSLMQHHGSKTRLLDFSFSPLSALYFAAERNSGSEPTSFAVWAIKLKGLKSNITDLNVRIDKDTDEADEILKMRSETDDKIPGGKVLVVRPKISNSRLSAQNGLFLMPCNMGVSFEANLREMVTSSNVPQLLELKDLLSNTENASIIKFVFDSAAWSEVSGFLGAMQITPRSIFPDMKGLAESVTWNITDKFKK